MLGYEALLKKAMKSIKRVEARKRFEIPRVSIEIQGNKTIVKNFSEILSVLRRDANHLAKFLFKQLATPGSVQGSVLILQTKLPEQMLQKKIEDYAKAYVYCKECGEPDTKLAKEGRITFVKCEACGAKFPARGI